MKALRFVGKSIGQAALSAVLLVAGVAIASNVGSGGNATTSGTLGQFAATTSAQFFGVISNETGTGFVVASSGPTFTSGITADRITLTSTSGAAVTATGQGTGSGVRGTSTDNTTAGYGLEAVNSSGGYALVVNSDTTSPARGAFRMTPQDTNPTTALVGDEFTFTGGYLRMATATTPTWNDVAAFMSQTTGVTAFAGGGQASATAVCNSGGSFTVGTVASAGDSVKLPATPVVGQICEIKNKGANSMNLFPGSGDVICNSGSACGVADAALAVAANIQVNCRAESVSTWNCK